MNDNEAYLEAIDKAFKAYDEAHRESLEARAEALDKAAHSIKEQHMSIITIQTWLVSGANCQSNYCNEFEVEEAEWSAMSEDERDEYAKKYAWDRMEWGWVIKENQT